MKTTVEVDSDLLKAAKRTALEQGITLKELMEQALRLRLDRESSPYGAFGSRAALYEGWDDFFATLEQAFAEGETKRGQGRAS